MTNQHHGRVWVRMFAGFSACSRGWVPLGYATRTNGITDGNKNI